MDQPVPKVVDADVDRIVRRDYPSQEVPDVLTALDRYGAQKWHREVPRVRLAILKLAGGDSKNLNKFIAMADQDYRDVVSFAEYSNYYINVAPAEAKNAHHDEWMTKDWEAYREWFERTTHV